MSTIATQDGTQLYNKDWGTGQPVVFSHGWPLSADSWEGQMMFLASNGYRCIAHDRRGHGRSRQPWNGNDMDTYADDRAVGAQRSPFRRDPLPAAEHRARRAVARPLPGALRLHGRGRPRVRRGPIHRE